MLVPLPHNGEGLVPTLYNISFVCSLPECIGWSTSLILSNFHLVSHAKRRNGGPDSSQLDHVNCQLNQTTDPNNYQGFLSKYRLMPRVLIDNISNIVIIRI